MDESDGHRENAPPRTNDSFERYPKLTVERDLQVAKQSTPRQSQEDTLMKAIDMSQMPEMQWTKVWKQQMRI
jgi:hypothetical protein